MKNAILALALLPLSLSASANVVFETTKSVDREVVVIPKEINNIENDIIQSVIENERNRLALHFSTFTGEEVESGDKLKIIKQGNTSSAGVVKPDIVLSDLVYKIKPCGRTAARFINAVCVGYKANVELTINSSAFMDEGEVESFKGRLSKASRLLLKRNGKKQ